jgi:tRNA(Leu) C34 or U34 (ribose-2'-O)-methylase TrmL
MSASIHLVNPKTPANVGGVLRALSIFGSGEDKLTWSGDRVHDALLRYTGTAMGKKAKRLPREERMKQYDIEWGSAVPSLMGSRRSVSRSFRARSFCLSSSTQRTRCTCSGRRMAPKGTRHACHYFVTIPTKHCGNLAAMANVVLYDRLVKQLRDGRDLPWEITGELVGR